MKIITHNEQRRSGIRVYQRPQDRKRAITQLKKKGIDYFIEFHDRSFDGYPYGLQYAIDVANIKEGELYLARIKESHPQGGLYGTLFVDNDPFRRLVFIPDDESIHDFVVKRKEVKVIGTREKEWYPDKGHDVPDGKPLHPIL